MISLDPGPDDSLYIIRRESQGRTRTLYVTIDKGIIPNEDFKSTYGPSVIRELQKLEIWKRNDWTTIRVRRLSDSSQVICEPDVDPPHGLPKQCILTEHYPMISLFDLDSQCYISRRVSMAIYQGQEYLFKMARFDFEIQFLAPELQTYYQLARCGLSLIPRLVGYIYKETPNRAISFLLEALDGRFAEPGDVDLCNEVLDRLHQQGVIHGDFRKYNCLITAAGPRLIDFEASIIRDGHTKDEWDVLVRAEKQSVEERLADESGIGRPLGLSVI